MPSKVAVTIRWTETYKDCAGGFLKFMDELAEYGSNDNIRVVMFFDN